MAATPDQTAFPRAGFNRRMGAILYDLLVIAAVIMLAGFAALGLVILLDLGGLIETTAERDHASYLEESWLYRVYLVAVIFWFYAGFWVRGGQTLGMRAWRLRVQNTDGSPIRWRQAAIRLLTAAFGISNLGVFFGPQRLAWQDRAAQCEVVVLSAEANQLRNWRKNN